MLPANVSMRRCKITILAADLFTRPVLGYGAAMEMPNKLKMVLAIYAVSIVLDLASQSWVSAAVGALIAGALFKGHEGMRSVVLWCSALGFFVFALFTVLALLALPITMLAGPLVAIGAVLALALSTLRCAFTVWVLRQSDVQKWMYARSTNAI